MQHDELSTLIDAGKGLAAPARPYYVMALSSFDSLTPEALAHIALGLGLSDLRQALDDGALAFAEWFALVDLSGHPEVDAVLSQHEQRIAACGGSKYAGDVIELLKALGKTRARTLH